MRKRLETWAAAAAMAEGGYPEAALEMCRELDALEARGNQKIVAVTTQVVTPTCIANVESLLKRFPADILLASMPQAEGENFYNLLNVLSAEHFVKHLHIQDRSEGALHKALDGFFGRLSRIQFVLCMGKTHCLNGFTCRAPFFTV